MSEVKSMSCNLFTQLENMNLCSVSDQKDQTIYPSDMSSDMVKSDISTYTMIEDIPDPIAIYQMLQMGKQVDQKSYDILKFRKWRLTPLYKIDARGGLLMWYISFDIDTQKLNVTFGHVGGKIRTETAQVETNQSNRNIHEQSVLEARSRYKIKYRNEFYRPSGESTGTFTKPMLAKKLEIGKTKLRYPVMVQPKLDGARCLTHRNGEKLKFRSRADNEWPHLDGEFGSEIVTFMSYIPYDIELDGEVYLHGEKFTQFSRILKNFKNKHPRLKELQYCIYDFYCPSQNIVMEDRYVILTNALTQYIKDGNTQTRFIVLQSYLANSLDEIQIQHRHFKSLGFEGTIIRKLCGPDRTDRHIQESIYKAGRGLNLIKYKDVEDAEGKVVGIENAGGSTEEGAALLVIECKHNNANGSEVKSHITMRPAFPIEERRSWYANPSLIMGKMVTYYYDSISEYGIPRCPVMKDIRDYE